MQNFEQFISDLKTLISFKTVLAPADGDAPFGKQTKQALHFILDLAKSFGFETKNYDNYMGEIIFGEGEEIGIIGHIDVVPEGDGWNTDPYTLTEKDGVYYARGTADDKTPTLLSLYLFKELKDMGITPKRMFRLFIGCNEETGWKDVEYAQKFTSFPEYGFSPDGNFPLSYAEKGVLVVKLFLPLLKNFYDVKGGTVVNAVCGYASAKCKIDANEQLFSKHGLTVKDGLIESVGVSCHGSIPECGKNALKPLFNYFADMGEDVNNFIDCAFNDKWGIFKLINEQGGVTFSPDLIEEKEGKIIVTCDCRIPAPFTKEDVINKLDKFNIEYTAVEKHPPLLVPKDGWFVETLINAYNNVMGTDAKPHSMCGSTFARVFKMGCAFGAELPGTSGHVHEANERIAKKDLLTMYEIYKEALIALAKV